MSSYVSDYISQRLLKVILVLIVAAVAKGFKNFFTKKEEQQDGSQGHTGSMPGPSPLPEQNASQPVNEGDGKTIMRLSADQSFEGLAFGVVILVGVILLELFIFTSEDAADAWEQAGYMFLLLPVIPLLLIAFTGGLCYYRRKNVITCDETGLVISRPFKSEDRIYWTALGRVEIQKYRCILYDRYGQLLLNVHSGWDNYDWFCRMAKAKVEENAGQVIWK